MADKNFVPSSGVCPTVGTKLAIIRLRMNVIHRFNGSFNHFTTTFLPSMM